MRAKNKVTRKEYKVSGITAQFVPYDDGSTTGYIRFEKDGEYLFSFANENRHFLRKLKATLKEWGV
jgi:hypothetical protein